MVKLQNYHNKVKQVQKVEMEQYHTKKKQKAAATGRNFATSPLTFVDLSLHIIDVTEQERNRVVSQHCIIFGTENASCFKVFTFKVKPSRAH